MYAEQYGNGASLPEAVRLVTNRTSEPERCLTLREIEGD